MRISTADSVLMLVLLSVAAPSGAAVCPVLCAGAGPHDADISLALSCAGPEGTVVLSGNCLVQTPIVLALPGLTLRGSDGAIVERILPAPAPGFSTPGAAIVLSAGASRNVIRDLDIRGASHGISTSPNSTAVAAGQPDQVSILNCRVEAGRQYNGDAIFHLGMNGPPFNDIDACTGLPKGLATDWIIADNELASRRGSGIVHGGSGFRITDNHIVASQYGIHAMNNAGAPMAQPFGSAPGNANNFYSRNTIEVTANDLLAPGIIPAGIVDFGFPAAPLSPPSPDGCDRGHSTLWERNCIVVTPDGLSGRDYGIGVWIGGQGNDQGSVRVEKNVILVNAPQIGDPAGNVGVRTDGSRFALVEKNDFSGTGDFAFLSLRPDAEGNRYLKNRIGPAFSDESHFVHDYGVAESSCYSGNHYCDAHEEYEGDGADQACGQNFPGTTCSGVPAKCAEHVPTF